MNHWKMYRKVYNYINLLEKRLTSQHVCRMIEGNEDNSSRIWKCLRDALPMSSNYSVSTIKAGKKFFSKPSEVAKVLKKHFTTICQKIAKACRKRKKGVRRPLQKKTVNSFHINPITNDFIKHQLKSLKANKAIGLDKISARLLRGSSDIIAPSLQALINRSFL